MALLTKAWFLRPSLQFFESPSSGHVTFSECSQEWLPLSTGSQETVMGHGTAWSSHLSSASALSSPVSSCALQKDVGAARKDLPAQDERVFTDHQL